VDRDEGATGKDAVAITGEAPGLAYPLDEVGGVAGAGAVVTVWPGLAYPLDEVGGVAGAVITAWLGLAYPPEVTGAGAETEDRETETDEDDVVRPKPPPPPPPNPPPPPDFASEEMIGEKASMPAAINITIRLSRIRVSSFELKLIRFVLYLECQRPIAQSTGHNNLF
jgi:hypothetical protein